MLLGIIYPCPHTKYQQGRRAPGRKKAQIDATDKEIDRMVYELVGLTEEEMEMVEKG